MNNQQEDLLARETGGCLFGVLKPLTADCSFRLLEEYMICGGAKDHHLLRW